MFTARRRSAWNFAASTVVCAAAVVATLTPTAQAVDNAPDPAVAAALQRHADGSWTQADVDLIRSIPELAAVVADPTRPVEVTTKEAAFSASGQAVSPMDGEPLSPEELAEVMPPAHLDGKPQPGEVTLPAESADTAGSFGTRITGGRWKMTHVTHTHRSYSGSVIYKYQTWAEFNYGGGKVRAWRYRADDITNASEIVNVDNRRIVDSKTSTPASSATSKMKRKVELCIFKYGCYSTMYPYVYTTVKGTGRTSFTSGV
ncbi:hypothetical protein ABZ070_07085 [Streptomyces sp. NPDC006283]|uniref:hypothetical protein n=1 Tax=Streptomyces sp. NPDC006283 TaxID=3156741 RepID=UPI0033BB1725